MRREENKKIKSYSLGCKVNQYDGNYLAGVISSRFGLAKLAKENREKADFVIINTCAVTCSAVAKSRKMIKKAGKENPGAKIYATGCGCQVYPEEFDELKSKRIAICSVEYQNYEDIAEEAANYFELGGRTRKKEKFLAETGRSRYFLKIQDGCNQFCSYCIVPFARKHVRSRNMPEVVEEAKNCEDYGYEEIVLTGTHIGKYGREEKNGIDLVVLMNKILQNTSKTRIRLSSIEINEISEDLLRLMQSSKRICRHLHIPLQSGSDKILKKMKRPYCASFYKRTIQKIKRRMPDICLTTDVIAGFPSESGTDFKLSYAVCEELGFAKIHVFNYSEHKKTAASMIEGKVDEETKKERADLMRKLSEKERNRYLSGIESQELELIMEKNSPNKDQFVGKSQYYFDVAASRGNFRQGCNRLPGKRFIYPFRKERDLIF
ncbi:MAG: tRNA (N(6)-L-threonylcarbamoyladenosine(37)-C(2))-methylthiotransferase MtaB [Candidatus Moranbacteria bacterium]|nr:tRNA (N(6)-L-threonylcarbamoyladenosine(37)-C(2))-methylthiotransferase MtaB [Candidatus Moranbacteria bacterium]